jgi:hypothetical protein
MLTELDYAQITEELSLVRFSSSIVEKERRILTHFAK